MKTAELCSMTLSIFFPNATVQLSTIHFTNQNAQLLFVSKKQIR